MKDIFDIVEIIKQIKGFKTDNEVAESLNMRYDALTNRKTRRSIPFKEVVELCEREGISLNRVFFGEDNVGSDYAYIPLYDIRPSAGPGTSVETEEVKDFLAFKQEWIRGVLRVNPKDLKLVYVDGDSMEPTLHNGDIILVNVGNHSVVRDGVYVVRIGAATLVKRLQLLPGNKLKVKSDNEGVYESFLVDLEKLGDEVSVIGRVVWAGRGL